MLHAMGAISTGGYLHFPPLHEPPTPGQVMVQFCPFFAPPTHFPFSSLQTPLSPPVWQTVVSPHISPSFVPPTQCKFSQGPKFNVELVLRIPLLHIATAGRLGWVLSTSHRKGRSPFEHAVLTLPSPGPFVTPETTQRVGLHPVLQAFCNWSAMSSSVAFPHKTVFPCGQEASLMPRIGHLLSIFALSISSISQQTFFVQPGGGFAAKRLAKNFWKILPFTSATAPVHTFLQWMSQPHWGHVPLPAPTSHSSSSGVFGSPSAPAGSTIPFPHVAPMTQVPF